MLGHSLRLDDDQIEKVDFDVVGEQGHDDSPGDVSTANESHRIATLMQMQLGCMIEQGRR
jgi:hypothetical protein